MDRVGAAMQPGSPLAVLPDGAELAGPRRRLRLPPQALPLPCVVQVTGDDAALNTAFALAWLGFPQEDLAETGYALVSGKGREEWRTDPAPGSAPRHYIGPHFRWEVSGFWSTVREEIALGGTAHEARVTELAQELRLDSLLLRNPGRLSGGETAKLILAAHLVQRPRWLVLDRVLGELDVGIRAAVLRHLKAWVPDGLVLVIDDTITGDAATAGADWTVSTDGAAAEWRAGRAAARGAVQRSPASTPAAEALNLARVRTRAGRPTSEIELSRFTVTRAAGPVFAPLDCVAGSGDLVLVRGPNGCGKTTLLEGLAGLLERQGRLAATSNGAPLDTASLNSARVFAFSPQDPQCDITEIDIERELALACGDARAVPRALAALDFPPELLRTPLHEDVGVQKLTSVIAATLRGRPCCLLDEPTIYLGRPLREVAERAIRRYLMRGGIVFCSSHDAEFIDSLSR